MRSIIAQENGEPITGRVIEADALVWSEGPIPITVYPFQKPSTILGAATELRREDNGDITAEVGDLEPPLGSGFTISANELLTKRVGRVEKITHARIREIFISDGLPWARKE